MLSYALRGNWPPTLGSNFSHCACVCSDGSMSMSLLKSFRRTFSSWCAGVPGVSMLPMFGRSLAFMDSLTTLR